MSDVFSFIAEVFSSEVLLRISLFMLILFGIMIAWRLQRTMGTGVDFADFLRDPFTQRFTTERLGHFVALWVTTVAFVFLMTVEGVDKIDLFLVYGGLWITSRALDKFASQIGKKAIAQSRLEDDESIDNLRGYDDQVDYRSSSSGTSSGNVRRSSRTANRGAERYDSEN